MKEYKLFRESHPDDGEDIDAFFEMKGWRNDLWLCFDSMYYKLEFETPNSLNTRIIAQLKANNWSVINPYVIVIEDINMSNILNAVAALIEHKLLNSYIPIEFKEDLIEVILQ